MLTIKSMKQIRIIRACRHATGQSAADHYKARVSEEDRTLIRRKAKHLLLDEHWVAHFERAAGPLRVLPPTAHEQQASAC
tara:strand:+ start:1938 stop:2177 length:240 start_codon:yes stop_codon:yes gene_type:complete